MTLALVDAPPADTPDASAPRHPASRDVDALVREHLPLVGHLVRGVHNRIPGHVHRDELVSAGMLALVLAARSFDPARGVPFSAFATIRIRGALTDALRSMDWAGRTVRTKARQLQSVRDELAAALRRAPTREEVAQAMGVAIAEVDAVDADAHRGTVVSLQALTSDKIEELVPAAADSPEGLILKREEIGYLHDAIAELPDRVRTVVQQYFFEHRKMADIAADLGVTESRISQLRSEALVLLRGALKAMDGERRVAHRAAQERTPRQHRYATAVLTRSTLADRLSATNLLGEPRSDLPGGTRPGPVSLIAR